MEMTLVRMIAGAGVLGCALIAFARPAAAQTPPQPGPHRVRFLVTGGLGAMSPVSPDDAPEGPVYLGGVVVSPSPTFAIEGEATYRAAIHETTRTDVTLPDFNCPTGQPCQVGHADEELYRVSSSDWTLGVNAIRRFPGVHYAVFAGGGFMFHTEAANWRRTLTNCTNPGHVSAAFVDCNGFDRHDSSQGAGIQGLAGVDIYLTSRLLAYGGIRYEFRHDLGYGTFGATGGLRVALR